VPALRFFPFSSDLLGEDGEGGGEVLGSWRRRRLRFASLRVNSEARFSCSVTSVRRSPCNLFFCGYFHFFSWLGFGLFVAAGAE
jgi:hypothetical protein